MNLDELKSLNIKDIGGWPVLPKMAALAALLIAVVFAAYWFDWSGELEQLETVRQEESGLRETFLSKKKKAINLDTYRQQLKEIDQSFGALLKQLPNKSEMDALLVDINQAGLGRGLEFELFKPAASEVMSEFYAQLPVTIKVTGEYHDLGNFASDISQMPRIVTLNEIKITAAKDGRLTMDGVAKTYRYLDEEEVNAQKKPAGGAKK
ncbi:MAG: type 4a pilus biogenesis protein PilO [Sulfurimicrobium sp.]|jgi:type IV pilus assembly protein PilO|nr:type 4a pilus biogenesis protein PilO [Sulfurimicrobium sp.]MDP2198423.1 type 4a pilus biogenesis protein PilO [Sulfurimicrobium sp.]MDP2961191.1 type 4a pilus biogenesis protein PilO [Sulfurimicrobium sp.]MDP3686423.1 type 4a pilus biogenesis protein PilO [Sulfurimicrobium sp.]